MKSILILGANPETASLVVKARRMGLYTIVTDYNPAAYAKRFADEPLNIDASDVDALERFVRQRHVDAVLLGVAEALLPSYCELCARLNLPCFIQPEQIEVMSVKDRFKRLCRQYGVPVVEEYAPDSLGAVRLPAVVKPVDSCSSRGISVCTAPAELEAAVERALSFSRSGRYLIERYMTGDEVVIYYVIQDGEPSLVAMCDRYTNKEQKGLAQLPTAYIFPSRHLRAFAERTDAAVRRMLKGMGLRNGTLFLQAFVDDDGTVRIYEPGFRFNGAQEHILVAEATGVDAKELLINHALTGRMQPLGVAQRAAPDFRGRWGCKLSPLVKPGRIARLRGLDEIARMEGVLSVNPSYAEGDTVEGKGTLKQIVARFYIAADTRDQLKRRIDAVLATLAVEDERGRSMLLEPFSTALLDERYE